MLTPTSILLALTVAMLIFPAWVTFRAWKGTPPASFWPAIAAGVLAGALFCAAAFTV